MDLVFSFVLFCLSLFVTFFVFRFVSHNNVSKWKSERMRKKVELTCTRTYAQFKFSLSFRSHHFYVRTLLSTNSIKTFPLKRGKRRKKMCGVHSTLLLGCYCFVIQFVFFFSFFFFVFLGLARLSSASFNLFALKLPEHGTTIEKDECSIWLTENRLAWMMYLQYVSA